MALIYAGSIKRNNLENAVCYTCQSNLLFMFQDLRDGKKIKISRDDMLRRTGELFTLR